LKLKESKTLKKGLIMSSVGGVSVSTAGGIAAALVSFALPSISVIIGGVGLLVVGGFLTSVGWTRKG
jgi:hypothetical protein